VTPIDQQQLWDWQVVALAAASERSLPSAARAARRIAERIEGASPTLAACWRIAAARWEGQ
jgi:hypothetical protein